MRTPFSTLRPGSAFRPLLALTAILVAGLGTPGCHKKPPLPAEAQTQASIDKLKQVLRETVKDPARLEPLLALADQASAQLRSSAQALSALLEEQARLNLDYAATPEAFEALGARLQAQRQASFTKAMALRSAMAKLTTDEEWHQLTAEKLGLLAL